MRNYAEMSDFEINKLVTKHLLTDGWKYNEKEKGFIFESDGYFYRIYDYCNDPSDAWPIIVENGICITSPVVDGERWRAMIYTSNKNYSWSDKNPLRAAMIIFLMMNEDK